MKHLKNITIIFMLIAATLSAAPKQSVEKMQKELELLKTYLNDARDSLQDDIAERWAKKQRYVNQREVDKEELAALRTKQERSFNQLSRLKEECFAKERTIEDEKEATTKKKDEWSYLLASMNEVFDKEEKRLSEAMPMDMESDRETLSETRRTYASTQTPIIAINSLLDYYDGRRDRAGKITITKEIVMPDDDEPQSMTVVRFGDIFGYALTDGGTPYVIRQTGKLGLGRYTIEAIGSPGLAEEVIAKLPVWAENGRVAGAVELDVMQNNNSSILISGKKVNFTTKIQVWLKAGGPIMLPLIGLFVWAIILVLLKIFQFKGKHKDYEKTSKTVLEHLSSGNHDAAHAFAEKQRGVVAKVVKTCLEHRNWSRKSAEQSVKEILLEEVPQLNKSLATLAVIAGAAPMLGLLGTVTGMISLFEVITHYGTGDPKILAGGISEALVTTQTGLAVAIPILLVHNFLLNRSNHIQSEMQKHAVRILNRLWPVEE